MKVIVDLHAPPASQNGFEHSGSRDGFQEWGASHIPQTVAVIEFLAQRYANRPSLGGIQLMNEPFAPAVTFDDLGNYYRAGYEAVRKYSSSAYVILSSRLAAADDRELLPLAYALSHSVAIDVHYYNLFSDYFSNLSPKDNIDFIYDKRAKALQEVTPAGGPLSFLENGRVNGQLKTQRRKTIKGLGRLRWRFTGRPRLDGLTGLTNARRITGVSSG
ncbi:UNVERIFIED_CONTAM: Glucan 1,3-beta-glucosidase [Sesamum radiatum]|uniref:Glucan 1,3-beta-glucosidase n=1 Tax=Sesamum radiatum TaxID=300843 RepID=A0AAW2Q1P1_SESRA